MFTALKRNIDWTLFFAMLPIILVGLVTMNSFSSDNHLFDRQALWIVISLVVFFALSFIDFRFLRRTDVLVTLYFVTLSLLVLLFGLGHIANGAKSWFDVGGFSFQPSDPMN